MPFDVKLTCTTHAGMDGCVAAGRVDLSEFGSDYRFMCQRQGWQGTVAIDDADLDLSGVRFDVVPAGSQQDFNLLRVQVEKLSFDPNSFVLDWQVTVNWKASPSAMVDRFTAEVFGEIVWTTNQDSHLVRTSGWCNTPDEQCTASASTVTWPTGWIYGGTALSSIQLESQSSVGVHPTEVSAEITEVVGSIKAKAAPICTLSDGNSPAPGLQCDYNQLTIVGTSSEVFRAWVGPFTQSSSPAISAGFSTPFYKKAAARCGLRAFSAVSGAASGGATSVLWFGANSSDCGWSPGDVYNGIGLYGFEATGAPGASPKVSFSLDATRLP